MGHYDGCYEYDNVISNIREKIEQIQDISINEGNIMAEEIYRINRYKTPTDEQILNYLIKQTK
jgi:hypothetical protein